MTKDKFDLTRSALMKCNYPIIAYTNWYDNWRNVNVLPVGKNPSSGHAYTIRGWKQINGEPMLIVDAWLGYEVYMPRETFNKAVSAWGCGTAVFSTLQMDISKKRNLIEYTIDLCKNTILLIKELLKKNPNMTPYQPINEVKLPIVNSSDELYWVAYKQIGKHLTLDTTVPSMYGCAQAVSKILKDMGYNLPPKGISSTTELHKYFKANFKEVETPGVGDLIISESFTGVKGARGHTGIVGKKAIMSNDSETGLWQPYWSLPAWLKFYRDERKLITKFYRV